MHDIAAIKEAISIRRILESAGIIIHTRGQRSKILCPYHLEKTPSCVIYEKPGNDNFHCFGCGANGDIIDLHSHLSGLEKSAAIDSLAALAGITPGSARAIHYTRPAPAPAAPKEIHHAPAMSDEAYAAWQALITASPASELERVAAARGYHPGTIHWLSQRGLFALRPDTYDSGIWREAFLVTRPDLPERPDIQIPITVHIRIGADGRKHKKTLWFYEPNYPDSPTAWPFILGQPHSATHLIICEGQWDAIAIADTMGWTHHPEATIPRSVAIIGLRGSSSASLYLAHYQINPRATAILLADNDIAGRSWLTRRHTDRPSFSELLEPRVRTLSAWLPAIAQCKDINDLTRAKSLTRAHLIEALSSHTRKNPQHGKKRKPTLAQYCRLRQHEPAPIGAACRHILGDKTKPKKRLRLADYLRHYEKSAPSIDPTIHRAIVEILTAWRAN